MRRISPLFRTNLNLALHLSCSPQLLYNHDSPWLLNCSLLKEIRGAPACEVSHLRTRLRDRLIPRPLAGTHNANTPSHYRNQPAKKNLSRNHTTHLRLLLAVHNMTDSLDNDAAGRDYDAACAGYDAAGREYFKGKRLHRARSGNACIPSCCSNRSLLSPGVFVSMSHKQQPRW